MKLKKYDVLNQDLNIFDIHEQNQDLLKLNKETLNDIDM